MWIIAGVLLGLVVLGVIAGFHAGPHAHAAAAAVGAVTAAWLLVMAALGYAEPLLYVLLAADVTVSGLVGFAAWRVLRSPGTLAEHDSVPSSSLEGTYGVAVTDLGPEGIVSVRGEQWTAVSLNGDVVAGTPVQVITASGVRLEVWGETNSALGPLPRDLPDAAEIRDTASPRDTAVIRDPAEVSEEATADTAVTRDTEDTREKRATS